MFRKGVVAAALLGLFAWVAGAQDAKTVIANVSKAMGADNRNVSSVTTTPEPSPIGRRCRSRTK